MAVNLLDQTYPVTLTQAIQKVALSPINNAFNFQGISRLGDGGFSRKATIMTSPTNIWVSGSGENDWVQQATLYEYTINGYGNTTDKDSETVGTSTPTGRTISLFDLVLATAEANYVGDWNALTDQQKVNTANLDYFNGQEYPTKPAGADFISGRWCWTGCGSYDAVNDRGYLPAANNYPGGSESFENQDKAAVFIIDGLSTNNPTAILQDARAGSAGGDLIVEMPSNWQTATGGTHLHHGSTGTVSNNQRLSHGPGLWSSVLAGVSTTEVEEIAQTTHLQYTVSNPHWQDPSYVTVRESDSVTLNPDGRDPANFSGLVRDWTYLTRAKGAFFDGNKLYLFGRIQGSMNNIKGPQFHVTVGENARSYEPNGIGYIGYKDPDSLGGGTSGNNAYDAQDKCSFVCQIDLADMNPTNSYDPRVKNAGRFETPFDRYNGEDSYTWVDDRGDGIEFAYQFGDDLYLGVTWLYTPFNERAYSGETAILKYSLVNN